jgi:uncharacterized protein (TIGR02246 family)
MMRIPGIIMLACLVFPAAARAQSVQQQITPLMDEMMVAANAHDTDRFLARYLHDSSLVLVFNGVVTNGFDNVRALQLKWWNNGKSDVAYGQRGPSEFTVLSSDAAVVTNIMTSRRTLPSGETSAGEFAVTMVWQKQAGGWRIVQVHESTVH